MFESACSLFQEEENTCGIFAWKIENFFARDPRPPDFKPD